jgi:simple sugar transport system permease protein
LKRAAVNLARNLSWNLALGAAASFLAVLIVLAVLWAIGYAPTNVAATWASGAAGDWGNFFISLRAATPLILTGLAAGVAFRCGVFNIGGEGQFMAGSITAVAVATQISPRTPAWLVITLACIAAMFSGAVIAMIAALLERYRKVPLVLSTILLNAAVMYVVRVLIRDDGPLQHPLERDHSLKVAEAFRLPILHAESGLHAGVVIAFIAALFMWILQSRTKFGFELLVTGHNSDAARLAGISVERRAIQVMAISGALAGLGGAIMLLGSDFFEQGNQLGYGYAGVAVALLGRLHPFGILLAAIFFGMLDRGALYAKFKIGLSHFTADAVKGVMLLMLLAFAAYAARWRARRAPREAKGEAGHG